MSRAQATGEPIWVDCEGSGCPTHFPTLTAPRGGTCMMCGHWELADINGVALPHKRDDIIARVKRGDFG